MTCTTCPKRNKCTELCADAEAYVNQDNKPERPFLQAIFHFQITSTFAPPNLLDDIVERKKEELIFYFQKIHDMNSSLDKAILAMIYFEIPIQDIAKYLKISRQAVSDHLRGLSASST